MAVKVAVKSDVIIWISKYWGTLKITVEGFCIVEGRDIARLYIQEKKAWLQK